MSLCYLFFFILSSDFFSNELDKLAKLKGIDGCTQLIAVCDDHHSLLLSPIGHLFCTPHEIEKPTSNPYVLQHYPCTLQHILNLVDVVKHIHSRNVIHRDLKIGNIFASSGDCHSVFVNDLGSAVILGDSAPFGGTLHFA